jgi:hypothetical protein
VTIAQFGSALFLESEAAVQALREDQSLSAYYTGLGLHAVVSALFMLLLYRMLPKRLRQPRSTVLLLCFSLTFFIPFFGLLALWIALLVTRWLPLRIVSLPFRLAETPDLPQAARAEGRRFRELSVRPVLADSQMAPALRTPALNVLSTMPLRVVGELLHQLLADPVEEMRLVAYGLLDNREKELRQRISEQTAALQRIDAHAKALAEAADDPKARARLKADVHTSPTLHALHLRAMVELNFELVYQRLVQGDLRDFALQQALIYADQAINLAGPEPGLLQLRARVYIEADYLVRARVDLEQAAAHGAPPVRVLPYLAEIAYRKGDWPQVRSLLASLHGLPVSPRLAALRDYWCGPGEET